MSEIKVGQMYKQKEKPYHRKDEADIFSVTFAGFYISVIDIDGVSSIVGRDWIEGDCELIAEYPTWQEAVNSKEFKPKKGEENESR